MPSYLKYEKFRGHDNFKLRSLVLNPVKVIESLRCQEVMLYGAFGQSLLNMVLSLKSVLKFRLDRNTHLLHHWLHLTKDLKSLNPETNVMK